MKLIMTLLIATILFSCNNSKPGSAKTDSLTVRINTGDTLKNIVADTPAVAYFYIIGIDKIRDSIFLKADQADFHNGPNVVEEAKKMHRADTTYKNGKIDDIFVPDDYFIVNDEQQITRLYLPKEAPITMDDRISGNEKEINNYAYFSKHYENSFFKLRIKNNKIVSVEEVFLP